MAFTVTELMRMKAVNGTIVKGTAVLTSSTTSGTIPHGLGMVVSVSLQAGSSTTGYAAYYSNSLPTGADIIVVATTGVTLSYMIAGY